MSAAYDLFQQGRNHLRSGMPAQATVALEKAKRLEPEKASIREALGIAYFRIKRWPEAEAEFRKVLELSPADDYAHYALGRTLRNQGRPVHYGDASNRQVLESVGAANAAAGSGPVGLVVGKQNDPSCGCRPVGAVAQHA